MDYRHTARHSNHPERVAACIYSLDNNGPNRAKHMLMLFQSKPHHTASKVCQTVTLWSITTLWSMQWKENIVFLLAGVQSRTGVYLVEHSYTTIMLYSHGRFLSSLSFFLASRRRFTPLAEEYSSRLSELIFNGVLVPCNSQFVVFGKHNIPTTYLWGLAKNRLYQY